MIKGILAFLLSLLVLTVNNSSQAQDPYIAWAQLTAVNGTPLTDKERKERGGRFVVTHPGLEDVGLRMINLSYLLDGKPGAKGIEAYDSNAQLITFTPPGPEVLRIPVAHLLWTESKLITITQKSNEVVIPEDKIPLVISEAKKLKYDGTDAALAAEIRARAVRQHSEKQVWAVTPLRFSPGTEPVISPDQNLWTQAQTNSVLISITVSRNICRETLANARQSQPMTSEGPTNESIVTRAINSVLNGSK